ncbi:hypothetical protein Pden_0870 [Paracoccus denitrificans PD1222]|uniref:Uncharacterized protein n=1 Tax=Paracoccus denitrificans (strain Pd 1222) TaxID=318586 RepID=A1B0D7_PARDP|nr:hypothetical protein Pden_0870 [Paracoccus denitrificans PD1222]
MRSCPTIRRRTLMLGWTAPCFSILRGVVFAVRICLGLSLTIHATDSAHPAGGRRRARDGLRYVATTYSKPQFGLFGACLHMPAPAWGGVETIMMSG